MLYHSLNKQSPIVDFKTATINGQAPDKGLYFPERIPILEKSFINNIRNLSKEAIAYTVIAPYVGDAIPEKELKQIVAETVNFDFPLVKVKENIYALELYHGPTLAFKDVGARFMSRCLRYFVHSMQGIKNDNKKITVLVATSGDTGGAVANGFYNVDGVEVVILYPAGKVSTVQEMQLTTLGNNIRAVKVNGNFDDCQSLVKQAFMDIELKKQLFLTSANSINVARWLPQQFYYFYALQQWPHADEKPVISVPSGNFGNICAGILAHISGLPVQHFIAACNANDTVTKYIDTGNFAAQQSVPTISNAMDVGNPSNFIRILELFQHQYKDLRHIMSSYSISDADTKAIIQQTYQNHQYLLDPHGAVGLLALEKYNMEHHTSKGIILETAHPIKFYDVVEPIIEQIVQMPESILNIMNKESLNVTIENEYGGLKDFLIKL
jgi:threonine synthase